MPPSPEVPEVTEVPEVPQVEPPIIVDPPSQEIAPTYVTRRRCAVRPRQILDL